MRWLRDSQSKRIIDCPRCGKKLELSPPSQRQRQATSTNFPPQVPAPPSREGLSMVSSSVGGLTDEELEDIQGLAESLRREPSRADAMANPAASAPSGGAASDSGSLRARLQQIIAQGTASPDLNETPPIPWSDQLDREFDDERRYAPDANEAKHSGDGASPPAGEPETRRTNLSPRPAAIIAGRRSLDEPTKSSRSPRETQRLDAAEKHSPKGPAGMAGAGRGSGFIMLPSDEIREALSEGPYHLRVDGREYGPLDASVIVTLIKHGVLLGGEEIAATTGSFVRLDEHEALARLRQKLAHEAHKVLRTMPVTARRVAPPRPERRDDGSGFILLPTKEINDSLEDGKFHLRIEGKVHGPLDASDLVILIKHGAILGADEVSQDGGPWLPVMMHPVFEQLRRRMAAAAHGVLRQMGTEGHRERK